MPNSFIPARQPPEKSFVLRERAAKETQKRERMNNKHKISVFLFLFFLTSFFANAQDPQFTQFYANPIYLNPALAGSKLCPRVCVNYRNEWPAISGTYVTTSASFDKMVDALHGGLGFIATNDEAGQSTIRTTTLSGIYSYHQMITRWFSVNAAMQATISQKVVDWDKLNFGDQIDPSHGFVRNTQEIRELNSKTNADFSAGIVGYSDKFFVGFSAHHLSQPNESFYTGSSAPLPMKMTAHAGANIRIGPKGNSDVVLSPNVIWQKQQDFQELNLGMYVRKGNIVGGMWYRSRDAFIVLIGIESGPFKIGYSYDLTVSRLTNSTAGSHELSLSLGFACKRHKPVYRLINCPSF
jgi:type IX secretion system PorP/SprF family membrane protein